MLKIKFLKKSFTKFIYLFFSLMFIISLIMNRYIEPFSTPATWAVFAVFVLTFLFAAFYSGQTRGILIGFSIYSIIILILLVIVFFVDFSLSPATLIILGVYWSYFAPFYPLLDIMNLNSFVSFLIFMILIYILAFLLNRLGKRYFSNAYSSLASPLYK